MGYTKATIYGITWTGILRIFTRGLSFLRIAVIARVLTPSQFGVYGIASLVLSFVEIVTESGINIFIIQEKEDLKKIVNTAWVVSILRGFIIFLLILIFAPFVAKFFESPDALFLTVLISFVPLIRGFINPSIIKFQQELKFKSELYFRGFMFAVESILAIIFVIVLAEPSGIIYALIAGAIFEVIISFIFVKPTPRFELDKIKARRIISRGKWTTAGGISNYLYHNVDDIVVGRVLGVASLGIYDMAYKISMLPITEIGQTISKVIFPVFTQISEDKKRLKRAFTKTIFVSLSISVPVGLIFFIFAEQLVYIVLGPKWMAVAPILRVLAIFGVLRTMLNPFLSLYISVKKQEYNTMVSTVSFLVLIVTIIPLINIYGLLGATISVVLGSLLSLPIALFYTYKIFKNN